MTLYELHLVQLNTYQMIASALQPKRVHQLALVCTEPQADIQAAAQTENGSNDGPGLRLPATIQRVPVSADFVSEPLALARELFETESAPEPRDGCQDCRQLEHLFELRRDVIKPVRTY